MIDTVNNTIQNVLSITWPMLVISSVVLISLRVAYVIKNKQRMIFYKDLLAYAFILYILCLFQLVTFRYDVSWSTNNFIPFKEILRYNMGSRLFFKNVVGNTVLFMPYGFFSSIYLKNSKAKLIVFLTFITSVAIEVVQLVIGRVFDIDDILLNLFGGYLGFVIYYFAKLIWDKVPPEFKNEWILNAFAIIILIIVISLI